MNSMVRPKASLDEVLDKFSIFGRYHLQLLFLAMFTFLNNSMLTHNYLFIAEATEYRCKDEIFSNNTCESINGEWCSDWFYENPHSFVAEFQLACQEWKRTFVGTVNSFGFMVGLLVVGPLSDRTGRKKIVIWIGVLGSLMGIAKSFSPSYWVYIVLEFVGSAFGDNYTPLYVLNLEMVSTKNRVTFHILCCLGNIIGGVLYPIASWGFPYWRNLIRAIYAPGLLHITYLFLMDESPRWLLTKGKKIKAIKVLKKMGDQNKIQLDSAALDKIVLEHKSNINFANQLKMTFQSRTLLKRCLVCIIWWTTSTFVNFGLVINSVSLQGNKYVNYALLALVDLPRNFVIMIVLNKYKRKIPLICSFFATAILCFIRPSLPSGYPWLSVTVYVINKLMSSFFFNITYIYTAELFPTYTRSSMQAICSSVGRVGSIIAPQTPLLMAYWSGLPTLIFGGASLAAGLVTFLVPDTADESLPDTVLEAEDIGNKEKHDFIRLHRLNMVQE